MKLVKAKNLAERSGQPWLKNCKKFSMEKLCYESILKILLLNTNYLQVS